MSQPGGLWDPHTSNRHFFESFFVPCLIFVSTRRGGVANSTYLISRLICLEVVLPLDIRRIFDSFFLWRLIITTSYLQGQYRRDFSRFVWSRRPIFLIMNEGSYVALFCFLNRGKAPSLSLTMEKSPAFYALPPWDRFSFTVVMAHRGFLRGKSSQSIDSITVKQYLRISSHLHLQWDWTGLEDTQRWRTFWANKNVSRWRRNPR